ncbi:DUF6850 family outer membrane beta-barrel protein [Porphyromonas macacae]|nr:DUF6850 family outer membrane beta-barrel protein [Porphyromonas macacae]
MTSLFNFKMQKLMQSARHLSVACGLCFTCFHLLHAQQTEKNGNESYRFPTRYLLSTEHLKEVYMLPSDKIYLYKKNCYIGKTGVNTFRSKEYTDPSEYSRNRTAFKIEAEAFHRLGNKDFVWGQANYINTKKEQILGHGSADISRIYPYTTIDYTGGNEHSETYGFTSGYARQFSKTTIGAEVSYRAASFSRKTDPRPLNVVSDINGHVALRLHVNPDYAFSFGLQGGYYKQHSQIKMFGNGDLIESYHYLGLGFVHSRFLANNANIYISGYSWGSGLSFTPNKTSGWMAGLAFNREKLTKSLDENGNLSPFEINRIEISAQAGKTGLLGEGNVYLLLKAVHKQTIGKEYLYGLPSSDQYPLIGSQNLYSDVWQNISLSGGYSLGLSSSLFEITGKSSWINSREQYDEPFRRIKFSLLHFSLIPRYTWKKQKWVYNIALPTDFTHNIQAKTSFDRENIANPVLRALALHRYNSVQGQTYAIGLKAGAGYALKTGLLFASPFIKYTYHNHIKNSSHEVGFTIGYSF